jgi:type VI secretion system secreted protein Hcp
MGYLELDGEIHNKIKGSCLKDKHKDWIEVLQYEHELKLPYNGSDTMMRGDTQQMPLRIIKEWDMASPLLHEALTQGEHFKTLKIEWFRKIGNKAEPELFFVHSLTKAKIVNIRSFMNHRDDSSRAYWPQHMEEISFVFEKIEWLWKPNNVSGKFSIR